MFSWIGYAIFGLVAGAIARLLHPGKDPMNWFWTMLLGIGGAFVGGYIGQHLGMGRNGISGWITAVGGAILLLVAYNFFTSRGAGSAGTTGGNASNADYKEAVFDDLSRGPR